MKKLGFKNYFDRYTFLIFNLIIILFMKQIVLGQVQHLEVLERNRVKNIQFNFSIPSARSVAMGGAFLAIANDATAGEANPAGLVNLTFPEASIHYRYNVYNHKELEVEGTGIPQNKVFSQSYTSVILPGKSISNRLRSVTISFHQHELINFKRSFWYEPFYTGTATPNDYVNGIISNSDLKVTDWTFACGYNIGWGFSIGSALKYSFMNFKFREEIYSDNERPESETGNLPQNLALITLADFSDHHFALADASYGLLKKWRRRRILGDKTMCFCVGSTYKPGAEFDLRYDLFTPIQIDTNGEVKRNAFTFHRASVLKMPDAYGIGFSAEYGLWNKRLNRVTERVLIAFDFLKIRYSQMIQPFINANPNFGFALNDIVETHFGLQFSTNKLRLDYELAVRIGFYNVPAHQIIIKKDEFEALKVQFPVLEPEQHVTCGLGIIEENMFQLALAYNRSQYSHEWLFSGILYIGSSNK